MDAAEFLALKLTLMFGVAIGAGFLFILIGSSPIWGMLLAGPGYIAPNLWLERRLQERQKAIRKDSVEFAVLMAAVLSAGGVGVNEALRSVGECVSGEIGKEVERTFREISAGQRRSDALEGMADRCGVEEISEIVRRIKTSDRYGVPVAEALRDYASQVYMMRKARAEEQAGKMLIKVIFPMIVFYLLPLFIMLFYPAIIKLGSILAI
jgi:tight adherence protein C